MQIYSINSTMPIQHTRVVFKQNTTSRPMLKTQNTPEKKNENNWLKWALGLSLIAIIAGICIYNRKKPKKPSKPTEPPKPTPKPNKTEAIKPVIHTEKQGNPRQLLNITEVEAQGLLKQYKEHLAKISTFKPWAEMTKEESDAAHKFYREEHTPLLDKIKAHNISVIEKKDFSLNPLEQLKEKHEYIHYEVLPKAEINEASFFDAMVEFEKYGKREDYAPMNGAVSTVSWFEMELPKEPTETTITKLIRIFGKHSDDFIYPDERYGAPNCIVYEQDFLQVAEKAKTVEQARLVLENGRRMFWSDSNINKVADIWMVNKGAPFKGNEEVKKILDEMFECAAKNREPFMNDICLQHEVEFWNRSSRRYKN